MYNFFGSFWYKNISNNFKGRRPLIMIGNFTMLISNLILALLVFISNGKDSNNEESTMLHYIIICFIFLFLIGNFMSIPPILIIYLPEILPNKGVMVTYLMSWFTCIFVVLLFPIVK